jgi:hypothetical protein
MTKDSIKRAIRTAVVVALALWIPGLLGWLNELTEWARNEGSTPFPDAKGLAYLGVVAIVGAFTGLVQWVWNVIEDGIGHGFLREVPAKPARGEHGVVSGRTVLAAAAVIVIVLVLVAVFTR